jgi:hypothetical protein
MHFVSRTSVRPLARSGIALVVVMAMATAAALPAGAQSAGWSPGPGAILDNTYDGYIDTPTSSTALAGGRAFQVAGWFVDKMAEGWAGADEVQIFNGKMGEGGTMLARALVAQNRPDVGAALGNPYWSASGFVGTVSLPQGSHTLSVYAHTGGKGWWYKQVSVNVGASTGTAAPAPAPAPVAGAPVSGDRPVVTITKPAKNEKVSTKQEYTIVGTAMDPAGAGGIDRVDVYIHGERGSQYSSQIGTARISGNNWELVFNPTKYPSIHSNLYVYAHSRLTGKETLVTQEFEVFDEK